MDGNTSYQPLLRCLLYLDFGVVVAAVAGQSFSAQFHPLDVIKHRLTSISSTRLPYYGLMSKLATTVAMSVPSAARCTMRTGFVRLFMSELCNLCQLAEQIA